VKRFNLTINKRFYKVIKMRMKQNPENWRKEKECFKKENGEKRKGRLSDRSRD
jgi:hypothetical protein